MNINVLGMLLSAIALLLIGAAVALHEWLEDVRRRRGDR